MSRIVSISASASPQRHPAPGQAKRQNATPLALPAPAGARARRRRQGGMASKGQGAAYAAQLLAGAPRRGLRASGAEQARIFAQYERAQSPHPPLGRLLRAIV